MSIRRPPQDLYDCVLELTTAIAQPEHGVSDVDSIQAAEALTKLVALFEARQAAEKPDPFLTETMADFTTNPNEAVRLYRLAIEQCAEFPDEPTYTKRQGLAEQLFELGLTDEAEEELARARREAFAAGDIDAIKDLNELAQ
jgi:hypothetical protein